MARQIGQFSLALFSFALSLELLIVPSLSVEIRARSALASPGQTRPMSWTANETLSPPGEGSPEDTEGTGSNR